MSIFTPSALWGYLLSVFCGIFYDFYFSLVDRCLMIHVVEIATFSSQGIPVGILAATRLKQSTFGINKKRSAHALRQHDSPPTGMCHQVGTTKD